MVRQAMFAALAEHFPEYLKRYGEEIQQGFTEPCFFVQMIDARQHKEFWRRYRRSHLFDVVFFPSPGQRKRQEALAVAERAFEALEYLRLPDGSLVRVFGDIQTEYTDEVLHITAAYPMSVIRIEQPAAKVQQIDTEIETKE